MGALWIGGFANERYAGLGSARMSNASLAKLDRKRAGPLGAYIWWGIVKEQSRA